ncbi:hypothetical protein KW783_01010 [Candidatus Parcubacteria bacterium]|nr:hypothetical protein [Candidatus Parcubacteria bacterium]
MGTSTEEKGTKIGWEYCECGCHGHDIHFGPVYFWMLNTLSKEEKPFKLNRVHRGYANTELGTYSTFQEADQAAREHAKEELAKLRKEVDRGEAGL